MVAVTQAMYGWWVERRKYLAQPLIRTLRPPPDPEDPDTTGVAFRPRESGPGRRMRTNNKKTFALMSQLRDEFRRLRQIMELVKRRERLKLEFHRSAGEYTEAAHRTLLNRLVRQRADPRAVWKDDGLDDGMGADGGGQRKSHKKAVAPTERSRFLAWACEPTRGYREQTVQPRGAKWGVRRRQCVLAWAWNPRSSRGIYLHNRPCHTCVFRSLWIFWFTCLDRGNDCRDAKYVS